MIIPSPKSIIPACDVDEAKLEELVKATHDLEGIGGYKLGFVLGLSIGLPRAVDIIRKYTNKPIIYDHQKAATDIPDTGAQFAKVCKKAGIDAIILFPMAGPETERAWIDFAFEEELKVIVGGLMTHKKYAKSEGGYLADDSILQMYELAAGLGVNDYVVPGNNPVAVKKIRDMLLREHSKPVFYSPGFISQGGSISESAKVAGDDFHPIVGRGIYGSEDMRTAAKKLCEEIAKA